MTTINARFRIRGVTTGSGAPADHMWREIAANESNNTFWYGYGVGTGDQAAASHLMFRSDGDRLWHDIIGASDGSTVFVGDGSALTGVTASIAATEAVLAAPVSLTADNTWTDAVTLSLAAGTWLLTGQITMQRHVTTATTFMARISDGTTHYASGQQYQASRATDNGTTITLTRVITLASAATIRLQGLCTSGANSTDNRIIAQLSANASGDTATILTAMRIA